MLAWLAVVQAGAASLFVELTLIRYVPGQMRVLGYFTNFVLLAAFLGLGIGILAARRWPRASWPSRVAPLALLAVVLLSHLGSGLQVRPSAGQFLFLEYQSHGVHIPLYPFLLVSYALMAAGFVPLGHAVGRTLEGPRPLLRYGLNIAGSLLGIALFVVASALSTPPWVWIVLCGPLLLVCLRGAALPWKAVGLASVVVAACWVGQTSSDSTWSPYQKLTRAPLHVHPRLGVIQDWRHRDLPAATRAELRQLTPAEGFVIRVNDDSYQTPVNLSEAAVARHRGLWKLQQQYDIAFKTHLPPGRVLVLGAGTGNDVAAALRAGATHVDAVEIDPLILELGRQHPERPYADPRVTAHVEDGRSFLARTSQRYDMIVYGLVDSHVLLTHRANVRLDSYVFTKESFALARRRLKPDGVLVVSHAVGLPWFVERMRATLAAAFGKPPLVLRDEQLYHPLGYIYVAGEGVRAGRALKSPPGEVLTDDWPFVYLEQAAIPGGYLLAMLLMAVVSVAGLRGVSGRRLGSLNGFFFALGAGFLLLETRGITVLALLAGSTWGVNAAVFAGVLLMALAATWMVARTVGDGVQRMPWAAYALLAATLAVNLLLPLDTLAALPMAWRIMLGAAVVSAPLLASGVVYARGLALAGDADSALASNLVGALLGGLLEYSSMMVGFRMLLLPAAAFYLLAMLLDLRQRSAS